MENLSKEQLLTLLQQQGKSTKAKKEKKKVEMTDEKREKMLERLSEMREIVKTNREKKKAEKTDIVNEVFLPKQEKVEIIPENMLSKLDRIASHLDELTILKKESKSRKDSILTSLREQKAKAEQAKAEPPKAEPAPKPQDVPDVYIPQINLRRRGDF